jgi:hypothetical protein
MKQALVLAVVLALVVPLLPACGKSDKAADTAKAAPAIDVTAVNALVPADLKAKLVFDKTDIVEDRGRHSVTYTMAAPKGWASKMKGFASLHPADDANLGFFTELSVGSNCDGTCEPKEWGAIADKVNFKQFANDKVIKNETTPNSRLLIASRDDKTTFVVYAWWQKGARRYNTCTATLDEAVKTAGDAFAKACQAVSVSGAD